jgi:hypothetical protein
MCVTTREHPTAEGGTVGKKCPVILPNCLISAGERPHTYALDRAVTGIGVLIFIAKFKLCKMESLNERGKEIIEKNIWANIWKRFLENKNEEKYNTFKSLDIVTVINLYPTNVENWVS